ncbi:MAG TPA: acetate/propionate family kinase [Mycobacteriales bacterium]|nr:acetate/propionate family kinase [Mycobacteriales bacterium]
MRVLVVNAGSSSLKLRLLDATDGVAAHADVDPWDGADERPIAEFAARAGRVDALGHRIVHGGAEFTGPVRIDAGVRHRIAALTDLAPLHQPRALAAVDAAGAALPGTTAVACFDTAFHAALPDAATTYAIPADWRRRWGLRRYGFHGLSHAYACRRAAELVRAAPEDLRVVSCHLGAGASLAAVRGGRPMDTTMGFTPLEGLVMATRSGTVDPGLVLWLVERAGLPAGVVSAALERDSGLAGLSGRPGGDLRAIRAAARDGDPDARLAIAVYTHRLRQQIAGMCAAMGGMDVLVFTGGVGEHDARLRRQAVDGLGFLGVEVDPDRNRAARGDTEVGAAGAPVRAAVVTAREDVEIARQTRSVLSGR